ncbi:MAG TPA: glycosyltransferase [Myxococcales bacterium]|nr:glycosyltransferase [Myxococcales bacterium]
MSPQAPRVSIGLAVFNGEKYLEQAVDSILAQTFADFELILSDNASTDRTAEICKRYAERDPRIRYSRNATNIGGANNENLTFTLSRGEYFRWAAHDDVCAPTLIERCVEVLDRRPEVVLCHSAMVAIDAEGKQTAVRHGREGVAPRPHTRFRRLSFRNHPCDATYGLVRSSIMRKTRLQQNYTDSDRVLLAELALHGPFVLLDEPLFFKRIHAENQYKDWRGRMAWFLPDLKQTGKATYPNWNELFDLYETINRVPLPWSERLLCRLGMTLWAARYGKGLAWDLIHGARMALHSQRWRTRRYAEEHRWR